MPATNGIWNPKAYGAKYDGKTDDHNAVQKAIDLCSSAGGGTVTVTGNIYNTAPIILKTGVFLDLANRTVSGPADPHIRLPEQPGADRMSLRGGFITSSTGDGVALGMIGGGASRYQLGWPRITVEGVTTVGSARHGIHTYGDAIEIRLINCVSLRAKEWGIWIQTTDSVVIGCTAAAGTGEFSRGIVVQGANNRLVGCKAYGNRHYGFTVEGGGRHMLTACEAQDNGRSGFDVPSDWNNLSGCLADTNGQYGYSVIGNNNTISGTAMYGGGGSGQKTPVGWHLTGTRNIVTGNSNCATPVWDEGSDNRRTVYAQGGAAHVLD